MIEFFFGKALGGLRDGKIEKKRVVEGGRGSGFRFQAEGCALFLNRPLAALAQGREGR